MSTATFFVYIFLTVGMFLLFVLSVFNGIYCFFNNKRLNGFICCLYSVCGIFLFFTIRGISTFPPVIILCIVLLACVTLINTTVNLKRRKHSLTSFSVKEFADGISVGMCFWEESGRVIFFNSTMDEICYALTQSALMNGWDLYEKTGDNQTVKIQNRYFSFRHNLCFVKNSMVHELIAYDVTAICLSNFQIAEKTEELRKMNEKLLEYRYNMEQVIREQEILQTKIHIHDSMNRLLLLSIASLQNTENINQGDILTQWKNNSLLLCMTGQTDTAADIITEIDRLGKLLGVEIAWEGKPTEDFIRKYGELFLTAAREGIANAVKHAQAYSITIAVAEKSDAYTFFIKNQNTKNTQSIKEGGGLSNLRRLIAENGGKTEISLACDFVLGVYLPK